MTKLVKAAEMPGSGGGFTMGVWNAKDVPVGSIVGIVKPLEVPTFAFDEDEDFLHRLDLLLDTKYPGLRKDALARKISDLANELIQEKLNKHLQSTESPV